MKEVAEYGEVMVANSHSEQKAMARFTKDVKRTHLAEVGTILVQEDKQQKCTTPRKTSGTYG